MIKAICLFIAVLFGFSMYMQYQLNELDNKPYSQNPKKALTAIEIQAQSAKDIEIPTGAWTSKKVMSDSRDLTDNLTINTFFTKNAYTTTQHVQKVFASKDFTTTGVVLAKGNTLTFTDSSKKTADDIWIVSDITPVSMTLSSHLESGNVIVSMIKTGN